MLANHQTSSATHSASSSWLSALAAGLPCLGLSYVLVNVWLDPLAWDNGHWVPFGLGIFLLEFLVLHSGAFIGAVIGEGAMTPTKYRKLVAMLAVYLVMATGFALSTDSLMLVGILAAIMLGRVMTALQAPAISDLHKRSAIGVLIYLPVAGATVFIAVPEMGITQEVLNQVYPQRGGGLWEQQPERAIVGGAFYFAILGLAELTILRRRA